MRESWAREFRPAQEALDVFNRLYELYGRLEREGESLQLYLGQGILVWELPSGDIRYPIILQRLQLSFDASTPEFLVAETDQPPELNRPLLLGTQEDLAQGLQSAEEELLQTECDLISTEDVAGYLARVAVTLHPQGRYVEGGEPKETEAFPQIGSDPVLLVQTRTQGFATALDSILEDLGQREVFPPGLVRISGIEPTRQEQEIGTPEARDPWDEPPDILMTKEANREQIQIAERLSQYGNVLVQGPPGTGKTHTIANLIGHLLACGKKVLVTAHTSKALRVLRKQVVEQLRALCVSVLDDETESRKQLEASVDTMVARLSASDPSVLRKEAAVLADQRRRQMQLLSETRKRIVDARRDEYRDVVVGGEGYSPSEAARFLLRSAETNAWIPGPLVVGAGLPLSQEAVAELYSTNGKITPDDEKELARWRPDLDLVPTAEQFAEAVEALRALETADLTTGSEYWEEGTYDASEDELLAIASRLRESVSLLADAPTWKLDAIAAGTEEGEAAREPWNVLMARIEGLAELASRSVGPILDHGPSLADELPLPEERKILEEILAHINAGGSLGPLRMVLKPRWKRLIRTAHVGGAEPSTPEHFEALLALARLLMAREALGARWDRQIGDRGGIRWKDFGERPEEEAKLLIRTIRDLLAWFHEVWGPTLADLKRAGLVWDRFLETQGVTAGSHMAVRRIVQAAVHGLPPVVKARLNVLQLAKLRKTFQAWARALHPPDTKQLPGSVVVLLRRAISERDIEGYRLSVKRLVDLDALAPLMERRSTLLAAVKATAPTWASLIESRAGLHGGAVPPGPTMEAWRFRHFQEELDRRALVSLPELHSRAEQLQADVRRTTAELIEKLAWAAQVERTGLAQQQALIGWKDLIRRIGKGTGKRAAVLKAEARRTLMLARDAVPVWIMPLARVVEAFDPRATRFDVVIVDESSQCDVLGLVALYMGSDIVVVGDHEQVSPSAVGQEISEVEKLIQQHLEGIPNKKLYDGKTSIYDLARQSFGGVIRLIEHFRCVPEIIAFSNHLSYGGEIRPLRDAASSTLLPAVIPYRVEGQRRAGGAKVNEAEAQTVAALICAALEHPAYSSKTMGVISLLGDEQALLIERLARDHVEPDRLERAQFLCGNAAQFQGDERDVMFLSLVDSAEDGPLSLRDSEMFRQRFNVAASRARDQMWVVYSVSPRTDLKPRDLRRRLIEHAEDPTAILRALERQEKRVQSEFERLVMKRLIEADYRVRAQYAVGFYRIDLVVEGAGRRLAVECDGDRYHPAEKIVEDMARQAILERLGWRFVRIRGSEFFRRSDEAMRPVFETLARMEIPPEGEGKSGSQLVEGSRPLVEAVMARASIMLQELAGDLPKAVGSIG
jgi:very-short-patch-repair endonuclease